MSLQFLNDTLVKHCLYSLLLGLASSQCQFLQQTNLTQIQDGFLLIILWQVLTRYHKIVICINEIHNISTFLQNNNVIDLGRLPKSIKLCSGIILPVSQVKAENSI